MSVFDTTLSDYRKRNLTKKINISTMQSEIDLVVKTAGLIAISKDEYSREIGFEQIIIAAKSVLTNTNNCVYYQAMAARVLGLLMIMDVSIKYQLQLDQDSLMEVLIQIINYFRCVPIENTDTRRLHANCSIVISMLLQDSSQEYVKLPIVIHLDSVLLALPPTPQEHDSMFLMHPMDFKKKKKKKIIASKEQPKDMRNTINDPPSMVSVKSQSNKTDIMLPKRKLLTTVQEPHSVKIKRDSSPSSENFHSSPYAVLKNNVNLFDENNTRLNTIKQAPKLSTNMERYRVYSKLSGTKPQQLEYFQEHNIARPFIEPNGFLIEPIHMQAESHTINSPLNHVWNPNFDNDDIVETKLGSFHNSTSPVKIPHGLDALLQPKSMLAVMKSQNMPIVSQSSTALGNEQNHCLSHKQQQIVLSKTISEIPAYRSEGTSSQHQHNSLNMINSMQKSEHGAIISTLEDKEPQNVEILHSSSATLTKLWSNHFNKPIDTRQNKGLPQNDYYSSLKYLMNGNSFSTNFMNTRLYNQECLNKILSLPAMSVDKSDQILREFPMKIYNMIADEFAHKLRNTDINHEQMDVNSQRNMGRFPEILPLKQIYHLPEGVEYCRIRMKIALQLWIQEYEKNELRVALTQWKALIEHKRFALRRREYQRHAAKKRIANVLNSLRLDYQYYSFQKWVHVVRWYIWLGRHRSAVKIQSIWRQHFSFREVVRNHKLYPFNSPIFNDIYLAPHRKLPFEIPPIIRFDRRALWHSAIIVQQTIRMKRFRQYMCMHRSAVILIQSKQRAYSKQKWYHGTLRGFVQYQALWKMMVELVKYQIMRKATIIVQRSYRIMKTRRQHRVVLLAARKKAESRLSATLMLQRLSRGMLARLIAEARRKEIRKEFYAALTVQRAWYRRNNDFPAFLLLCCLRVLEEQEKEFDLKVIVFARSHRAKVIQKTYRDYRSRKINLLITLIQKNYRMHVAKILSSMRLQQYITFRRVKYWFRVQKRQRSYCARKIQYFWLRAVPYRLVNHLKAIKFIQAEIERLSKESIAATAIQNYYRYYKLKQHIRRHRSAVIIRRAIYFYVRRKLYRNKIARLRQALLDQYITGIVIYACEHIVAKHMQMMGSAAILIQKIVRGALLRTHETHCWVQDELFDRMTRKIQRKWKSKVQVNIARHILVMVQRRQRNRYINIDRISTITQQLHTVSLQLYDPNDIIKGVSLFEWLYRLGLDNKYATSIERYGNSNGQNQESILSWFRGFGKMRCKSILESLLPLACDANEQEKNISDKEVLITNLFAYQSIKFAKAHLSRLIFYKSLQSRMQKLLETAIGMLQQMQANILQIDETINTCDRELLEFNHPPKGLRNFHEKLKSELLEKKKSYDDIQHDITVLHYGIEESEKRMRELQEESVQIMAAKSAATKSLNNFQYIEDIDTVRQIYLEHFPGLAVRAQAICKSLELKNISHVTKWKLNSYFSIFNSPREAKRNVNVLIKENSNAAEIIEQIENSQFKLYNEILQQGFERIGHILQIPLEELACAVANAVRTLEHPSDSIIKKVVLNTIANVRKCNHRHMKILRWQEGLRNLMCMDQAVCKVQWIWRLYIAKKCQRLTQYPLVKQKYVKSYHTDHITPFWEQERSNERAEQEKWNRNYVFANRIFALSQVLRFSYLIDENSKYGNPSYYRILDDGTTEYWNSEISRTPIYSIEEEDCVIQLQTAVRRFLFVKKFNETCRKRRKQLKKTLAAKKWHERYIENRQNVSIFLNIINNVQEAVNNESRITTIEAVINADSKQNSVQKTNGTINDKLLSQSPTSSQENSDIHLLSLPANSSNSISKEINISVEDAAFQNLLSAYNSVNDIGDDSQDRTSIDDLAINQSTLHLAKLLDSYNYLTNLENRKSLSTATIKCIRPALRFGWVEISEQTQESQESSSYFYHNHTREVQWERPEYEFDEDYACIQIQSVFKMKLAKVLRKKLAESFSFTRTIKNSVNEASRLGWIGFGIEGISIAGILIRLGLRKHVEHIKASTIKGLLSVSSEKLRKMSWGKDDIAVLNQFKDNVHITKAYSIRTCEHSLVLKANSRHAFNIVHNKQVMAQIVSQMFPNQQGRINRLIEYLVESPSPVSYGSLQLHLRQYAGRPDDAFENALDATLHPTATEFAQEAKIFMIYYNCISHCIIYAANLKLFGLQFELSAVREISRQLLINSCTERSTEDPEYKYIQQCIEYTSSARQTIIPMIKLSDKEKTYWVQQCIERYPKNTVKGLWEHDVRSNLHNPSLSIAQGALWLRERGMERITAWTNSSILIQSFFRMKYLQRSYFERQKLRREAAITLQCVYRSLKSFAIANYFREQQDSDYEQFYDCTSKSFYYVYIPTNEKIMEEPRDDNNMLIPFRPLIYDERTKKYIIAWPHYNRDLKLQKSPYFDRNSNETDFQQRRGVPCTICKDFTANRRCNDCYGPSGEYMDFCIACYIDIHPSANSDMASHTYNPLKEITRWTFHCVECNRYSTSRCLSCQEHYCERCFKRVHQKGSKRFSHVRDIYQIQSIACTECEDQVALRQCNVCGDSLCDICWDRVHMLGQNRNHEFQLILQPLNESLQQTHCNNCEGRIAQNQCKHCQRWLCPYCHDPKKHGNICLKTNFLRSNQYSEQSNLCIECGEQADRVCLTCGDRYCSKKTLNNLGCFERFHAKGNRTDHQYHAIKFPQAISISQPTIANNTTRPQVSETPNEEQQTSQKNGSTIPVAKIKQDALKDIATTKPVVNKVNIAENQQLNSPGRRNVCKFHNCDSQRYDVAIPYCGKHFTPQRALELTQDPLEAARLITKVASGDWQHKSIDFFDKNRATLKLHNTLQNKWKMLTMDKKSKSITRAIKKN